MKRFALELDCTTARSDVCPSRRARGGGFLCHQGLLDAGSPCRGDLCVRLPGATDASPAKIMLRGAAAVVASDAQAGAERDAPGGNAAAAAAGEAKRPVSRGSAAVADDVKRKLLSSVSPRTTALSGPDPPCFPPLCTQCAKLALYCRRDAPVRQRSLGCRITTIHPLHAAGAAVVSHLCLPAGTATF